MHKTSGSCEAMKFDLDEREIPLQQSLTPPGNRIRHRDEQPRENTRLEPYRTLDPFRRAASGAVSPPAMPPPRLPPASPVSSSSRRTRYVVTKGPNSFHVGKKRAFEENRSLTAFGESRSQGSPISKEIKTVLNTVVTSPWAIPVPRYPPPPAVQPNRTYHCPYEERQNDQHVRVTRNKCDDDVLVDISHHGFPCRHWYHQIGLETNGVFLSPPLCYLL
mmetsp:Transcript_36620/g.67667  ORF Transcript_36620/g.67667 Transcript_36620/m.67667 type:complete len:219 (+) Transcript_36620:219-875(+)